MLDPAGIKLAAVATGNIYARDGLSLSHANKEVVSAGGSRNKLSDARQLRIWGRGHHRRCARKPGAKGGPPSRGDSYKRLTESVREACPIRGGHWQHPGY